MNYINEGFRKKITQYKCPICSSRLIPICHSGAKFYIVSCPKQLKHKFEIGPYMTTKSIYTKLERINDERKP